MDQGRSELRDKKLDVQAAWRSERVAGAKNGLSCSDGAK